MCVYIYIYILRPHIKQGFESLRTVTNQRTVETEGRSSPAPDGMETQTHVSSDISNSKTKTEINLIPICGKVSQKKKTIGQAQRQSK